MDRLLAAAFALLLSAVPSQLFGEGEATRITIQSLYLKAPIEIVDPVILSTFNVWTGPGTWSSDPAFNENAPGFIIDWSSGTVPEVPDKAQLPQSIVLPQVADRAIGQPVARSQHEG
jgi:hypothetical protein